MTYAIANTFAMGLFIAFSLIAAFFWRGRKDRIMSALFIFFAVNAVIFGAVLFSEAFINISVIDPIYGKYRPLVIRGATLSAACWLASRLYMR